MYIIERVTKNLVHNSLKKPIPLFGMKGKPFVSFKTFVWNLATCSEKRVMFKGRFVKKTTVFSRYLYTDRCSTKIDLGKLSGDLSRPVGHPSNGGFSKGISPKSSKKSGLGIILICPDWSPTVSVLKNQVGFLSCTWSLRKILNTFSSRNLQPKGLESNSANPNWLKILKNKNFRHVASEGRFPHKK